MRHFKENFSKKTIKRNKSVFSLLTTWLCSHLLLTAVLLCAVACCCNRSITPTAANPPHWEFLNSVKFMNFKKTFKIHKIRTPDLWIRCAMRAASVAASALAGSVHVLWTTLCGRSLLCRRVDADLRFLGRRWHRFLDLSTSLNPDHGTGHLPPVRHFFPRTPGPLKY